MLSRQGVRHASTVARQVIPEQRTKTSAGLTVASKDNHGPVSQLVLAFRAGSRHEEASQKGLVHHLKNMVGRDSKDFHGVSLIWSAQSVGASMTAFATRDLYGVHMAVPRDHAALALSVLGHVAANPSLKPWEIEEITPTLHTDLGYRQPFDIVFDEIHKAAYRNGNLGNSVFATAGTIGKINAASFEDFTSKHLVAGQGVLYGLNIEHDRLAAYGDAHSPVAPGSGVGASASPYKGGESRVDANTSLAHVILAGEGASASDAKAQAIQQVLLTALGRGPSARFTGKTGNGIVAKSVGDAAAVSSFAASHEGSGLAGIYLLSDASKVDQAVKTAVRALKSVSGSSFNIDALKNQARLNILRANAHGAATAIDFAAQVSAGVSDGAVVAAIEKVTAGDVEAAAKKLSSNLSIASYGKVEYVPYRDQL